MLFVFVLEAAVLTLVDIVVVDVDVGPGWAVAMADVEAIAVTAVDVVGVVTFAAELRFFNEPIDPFNKSGWSLRITKKNTKNRKYKVLLRFDKSKNISNKINYKSRCAYDVLVSPSHRILAVVVTSSIALLRFLHQPFKMWETS